MVCCNIESLQFKRVEIGYRFDPAFQGKGYAHEAVSCFVDFLFNDVKAHKITAYCVAENTGSYRLMEKIGMQREACLRKHSTLAGKWHDELVYGMFKSEFIPYSA
jgi:RimJ/RimL family protein N-acetyltransferase